MTDASTPGPLGRRTFITASLLALAGCAHTGDSPTSAQIAQSPQRGRPGSREKLDLTQIGDVGLLSDEQYDTIYASMPDAGFVIPRVNWRKFNPRFLRQVVNYKGPEQPGDIVADPFRHFCYLVRPNGLALRYGCGSGSAALTFQGEAIVANKQAWPRWIPTKDMIARSPEHYSRYAGGVEGGLSNPLGARALYLHKDNRDTYYRIHGTNKAEMIGQSRTSGCIRLFNQDVVHLHERVAIGAKVIVLGQTEPNRTIGT